MILVAHRTPASAPGCAALAAAGASMFEVDVQLRAGQLVVSHYKPLLHRSGWFERDNWRVRWRVGPPFDHPLTAMLDLVPAGRKILLDPKLPDPSRRAALTAALAAALPDRERFVVSTSNPADLRRYRAAGFRTWRTLGSRAHLDAALAGGQLADDLGVSVRQTLLDRRTLAALHEITGTVVAWTVNRPDRAAELRAAGVDGITTDNANILAALREQHP